MFNFLNPPTTPMDNLSKCGMKPTSALLMYTKKAGKYVAQLFTLKDLNKLIDERVQVVLDEYAEKAIESAIDLMMRQSEPIEPEVKEPELAFEVSDVPPELKVIEPVVTPIVTAAVEVAPVVDPIEQFPTVVTEISVNVEKVKNIVIA